MHIAHLWAIEHKPTGRYLPEIKYKRGYTATQPCNPIEKPPRLFITKKAAKCALHWWLKGEIIRSQDYRIRDWEEVDYEETLTIIPKPDRKAVDMCVRKVVLEVF